MSRHARSSSSPISKSPSLPSSALFAGGAEHQASRLADAHAAVAEAIATRCERLIVAALARRCGRGLDHAPCRADRCRRRPQPCRPATIRGSTGAWSRARWCARAPPPIRASSSGDRSKRACSSPTSWSWAPSTKAPGRDRRPGPVAQPADARGARPARAGGAHRPLRARLHLAARRRDGLSHARAKIDGVPTVPSRWLLRLQALVEAAGLERAHRARRSPGSPGRASATRADASIRVQAARAAPAGSGAAAQAQRDAHRDVDRQPLRHLRPRILARAAAAARHRARRRALRGQIVHEALQRFRASLIRPRCRRHRRASWWRIADEALRPSYGGSPRVAAFWAPRFHRFAAGSPRPSRRRRAACAHIVAEVRAGWRSTLPPDRSR